MHDTTGHADRQYSRRIFLQQGLTFFSLTATAPLFIDRTALAIAGPMSSLLSSRPGVPEDRVLVVVQLGGGNDGLNTVIPFGAPEYYRMRPGLAIPEPGRGGAGNAAALAIDQSRGLGLHPNMAPFKELMDDGVASIVQGVGYPNPNRSHFASMDIWHTADTSGRGVGWLGRYFDNCCAGAPDPDAAISIGRTAPLAMIGQTQQPVSFETAELFRWAGAELDPRLAGTYDGITRHEMPATGAAGAPDAIDPQLAFLTRTTLDAQISSDRIRAAVAKRPLAEWPRGALADQLRLVSAMIRDGLATRVYYVSLGGFDTHANQTGQHANLLGQLATSLRAFHRELRAQGNSGRVLTMVFSEFGRRVAQNASGGTDHGTAAPMYLVGDMVRPGLLGTHPSMSGLEQGDLVHTVDFRHVYASVLAHWMKADAVKVLGGRFEPAQILRA